MAIPSLNAIKLSDINSNTILVDVEGRVLAKCPRCEREYHLMEHGECRGGGKKITASKMIKMLLATLPDSRHDDDESWRWCWEELGGDAQEQVVEARHEAMQFLKQSESEATCPDCGEPWLETETIRATGTWAAHAKRHTTMNLPKLEPGLEWVPYSGIEGAGWIIQEVTIQKEAKRKLTKVWIVAQGGYDYDNLEILQICSTEEIAGQFLAEYNETHPKPFPWNQRGYADIELDKPFRILDDQEAGD